VERLASFYQATKLILDLKYLDWQTAWELIPFSWLLDYFINMSEFFQATAGSVIIEPYDICIMRELRIRERYVFRSASSGVSGGTGVYTRSIRQRDLVTTVSLPMPEFGFLTKNQYSTIAALLAAFSSR
jgi:hypothetical protein